VVVDVGVGSDGKLDEGALQSSEEKDPE